MPHASHNDNYTIVFHGALFSQDSDILHILIYCLFGKKYGMFCSDERNRLKRYVQSLEK